MGLTQNTKENHDLHFMFSEVEQVSRLPRAGCQ